LFLLRQGRDILIVQVYVDDIVFCGSSNSLLARFAEDMSREFEMSMMGELQFSLGLQIKQSKEGAFVHQAKYTKDIVRKFKMEDSKAMATPMSTTTALDADEEGEQVDHKEYRSMTGVGNRLDRFVPRVGTCSGGVCICARGAPVCFGGLCSLAELIFDSVVSSRCPCLRGPSHSSFV
jgi:hypothetical protein